MKIKRSSQTHRMSVGCWRVLQDTQRCRRIILDSLRSSGLGSWSDSLRQAKAILMISLDRNTMKFPLAGRKKAKKNRYTAVALSVGETRRIQRMGTRSSWVASQLLRLSIHNCFTLRTTRMKRTKISLRTRAQTRVISSISLLAIQNNSYFIKTSPSRTWMKTKMPRKTKRTCRKLSNSFRTNRETLGIKEVEAGNLCSQIEGAQVVARLNVVRK